MSSQIIAFIMGRREDILITLAVGLILLLLDYFVLRKRRTDSKTSNTLIATDRLIVFALVAFLSVFYIILQSGTYTTSGGASLMTFMFIALMMVVSMLISQRQRYLEDSHRPKKLVKATVQTAPKEDVDVNPIK